MIDVIISLKDIYEEYWNECLNGGIIFLYNKEGS